MSVGLIYTALEQINLKQYFLQIQTKKDFIIPMLGGVVGMEDLKETKTPLNLIEIEETGKEFRNCFVKMERNTQYCFNCFEMKKSWGRILLQIQQVVVYNSHYFETLVSVLGTQRQVEHSGLAASDFYNTEDLAPFVNRILELVDSKGDPQYRIAVYNS